MKERLLTARELGAYLNISGATVLDRFERGDLPGYRLFGKKGGPVRFRVSEIEAALRRWQVGRPEPEQTVMSNAGRRRLHA
jgi:excisionase family DNA binding protein